MATRLVGDVSHAGGTRVLGAGAQSVGTGALDTGVIDTGVIDTGVIDTGVIDTGVIDIVEARREREARIHARRVRHTLKCKLHTLRRSAASR